jgi:hypothetical protein
MCKFPALALVFRFRRLRVDSFAQRFCHPGTHLACSLAGKRDRDDVFRLFSDRK